MARTFNTKISGDQLTVEARSTTGTGGIKTNADGALTADWTVVPDKASIDTAVAAEITTRGNADSSLTTRVGSEETNRTNGDSSIVVVVTANDSSRVSGDTSLTNRTSTEESVRTAADTSLTTRLGTEEGARSTGVNSVVTSLSTETSLRASSDVSLVAVVSTDSSIRASADVSLTSKVSTETVDRIAGDSSIVVRVSAIEAGLVSGVLWKSSYNTLSDLTTALAGISPVSGWAYYDKAGNDGYVIVPEADGDLTIAGWTGFSLIKIADFKEIQGIQSVLVAADSAEASTRTSADTSLTTRLTSEESVRTAGDSSIVVVVDADRSSRVSGDTLLTNSLSTETSLRTVADTSLTSRLSTEEVSRTNGDSSIVVVIDSDRSSRVSGDTSLTARVSAEESARASADTLLSSSHKVKKFLARVGTNAFAAVNAETSLNLDTVTGSLIKSSDFAFMNDIIDMNLGENAWSGKAAFPVNFDIFVNGVILRPVIDAGKTKFFIDANPISFATLVGDYVFYKNHTGPTVGVAFSFALIAGDEIHVRYFND